MPQDNKKKQVIEIYDKAKHIQLTYNAEHFEQVDKDHSIYFGERLRILFEYINNISGLTGIDRNLLYRDIYIIKMAETYGYIRVDWEAFFEQSASKLISFSKYAVEYFKENIPEYIKRYKKFMKNSFKNRPINEKTKTILVFREEKDALVLDNEDIHVNSNNFHKKYFGVDDEIIVEKLKKDKGLSNDEKANLLAHINMLRRANTHGMIYVKWDKFFELSNESMLSLVNKTMSHLAEYHSKYDWEVFREESIQKSKKTFKVNTSEK